MRTFEGLDLGVARQRLVDEVASAIRVEDEVTIAARIDVINHLRSVASEPALLPRRDASELPARLPAGTARRLAGEFITALEDLLASNNSAMNMIFTALESQAELFEDSDASDDGGSYNSQAMEIVDPEALSLHCARCQHVLTYRAMLVVHVSHEQLTLFSSDIVADSNVAIARATRRGSNPAVPCGCQTDVVLCALCTAAVGYHVRMRCTPCRESESNGHFFMFHMSAVCATGSRSLSMAPGTPPGPLRWSELPYNGRLPGGPAADWESWLAPCAEAVGQYLCEICQEPL
eukprot:gene7465-8890_t